MASKLHWAKMAIAPAVGEGTTAEFNAFITIYETLPDLLPILKGSGKNIPFPKEPSTRYATTIGLTVRANNVIVIPTAIAESPSSLLRSG